MLAAAGRQPGPLEQSSFISAAKPHPPQQLLNGLAEVEDGA